MPLVLSPIPKTNLQVVRGLVILISLFSAATVNAGDICHSMKTLVEQTRINYLTRSTESAVIEKFQPLPGAEKCTTSKSLSGGNAYHCVWQFPYRDDAATGKFDALNDMMRQCFSGGHETGSNEGVNHPDTYDQRRYILDQVDVSISIKDKIGLQKTFIFIGVQIAGSG